MIKKLKLFICLISCIVLLPSVVDAHTLRFGEQSKTPGVTTIPVYLRAEPAIPENGYVTLECSTNVEIVGCSIKYVNGVLNGQTSTAIAAGVEVEIAKLELTNSDYSNYPGVSVTLKGPGGVTKTGTYGVDGKQSLKTSPKLSSLSVSQGTMYPAFDPDTHEYTVYGLKDTIISVNFKYTCDKCSVLAKNDDNVSVNTEDYFEAFKVGDLKKGDNTFDLVVTSEDGANKDTYSFRIIRGATKYNSSKLESLSVGDYHLDPKFKSDKLDYTISVPNSVEKLIDYIEYKAEDEDAEIIINGAEALITGENKVTIEITSVNKDNTTTYNLTVVRLPDDAIIVKKCNNKAISFIDANEKEQKMDEEEFKNSYPTIWEDIKSGKYKFDKDGNVVTGEEKEEEKKEENNNKTILIVVIIVVALIIIVVSGILLFRKKDPKEEELKKEEKIKKKAQKKAEKDRYKKLEEKYYDEYYGEENDASLDDEDTEIKEEDKLSKKETNSLLEDDYIFESSIIEDENNHEDNEESLDKNEVVDVDDALEDLMNTKTYDFSDELSDLEDEYEDENKDE